MGIAEVVELEGAKLAVNALVEAFPVDVVLLALREVLKDNMKHGNGADLSRLAAAVHAAYIEAGRVGK